MEDRTEDLQVVRATNLGRVYQFGGKACYEVRSDPGRFCKGQENEYLHQ